MSTPTNPETPAVANPETPTPPNPPTPITPSGAAASVANAMDTTLVPSDDPAPSVDAPGLPVDAPVPPIDAPAPPVDAPAPPMDAPAPPIDAPVPPIDAPVPPRPPVVAPPALPDLFDLRAPYIVNVLERRDTPANCEMEDSRSKYQFRILLSDDTEQWIRSGHPQIKKYPRLFNIVRRYYNKLARDAELREEFPDNHIPLVSLEQFKSACPEYSKKIAASADMDCVLIAVTAAAKQLNLPLSYSHEEHEAFLAQLGFSGTYGLPIGALTRYMDWFMAHGLKIDRSLFKKNCLQGTSVGSNPAIYAMEVM
ncbi:hypothetical protein H257_19553, partial [Aphanomyces astaci]